MRIAILSAASAVHTVRWANGLSRIGHEVILLSAHEPVDELDDRVRFEKLPVRAPLGYYANVFAAKSLLKKLKPDILNAHYASGYGTLARLVGYRPTLLSVWGSDVYDFPGRSAFHHRLIARNLRASNAVASTSRCMLGVTNEIFSNPLSFVTPFGIDEDRFQPHPHGDHDELVIGTVKSLADKYGIDTLIDTFGLLVRRYPDRHLVLEITGDGPDRISLEKRAAEAGLSDHVRFFGRVRHDDVPFYLHRLDIYVALSRLNSESFGVAILEASSCGLPVVVSDADGLAEVTLDGVTGFVVPRETPVAAANSIGRLIEDSDLRSRMGRAGRAHVLSNYTWNASLDTMVDAYRRTIAHAGV